MSPKKKNKNTRKNTAKAPADTAAPPSGARTADRAGPSRRRTPVALDEPRPRWPLVLWTALALAWLGGTALFFVLVLAESLAMMETQANAQTPDPASFRSTAWYLVGMLVCALAVPAAGAVAAALMRRKIAAGLFALAAAASAVVLFTLASPADLLEAVRGGLGG